MSDSSVIMPCRPDELVRQVGRELIERGFQQGTSLFAPQRSVWDQATAGELYRHYNEQPDLGSDAFLVKLERQLAGASDDAIQLAAELLTLQGLPLHNLTASKLHQRVSTVLSWMREPVAIPEPVSAAFAQRTWNGGTGAHTMLWRWLADAVELVRGWWSLPREQRDRAFADPWAWQDAISHFNVMPSLSQELLYLGFPSHFLPIVSIDDKKAIRDAFGDRADALTGDLNRDLFDITVRIQREIGRPVDFYQPPFVAQWRKQANRAPGEQRAWLVRPRHGGPDLIADWTGTSFVSLDASHLGEVTAGASRADIRAAVEEGYQHVDYAQRVSLANDYHAFVSQMAADDIVTTIVGNELYVGILEGKPEYAPSDDGSLLRWTVEWLPSPIPVDALPPQVTGKLDQPGAVVNMTGALEFLSSLVEVEPEATEGEPTTHPMPSGLHAVPKLAAPTEDLARRVHMSRQWLQDLLDLWQERPQIILYGPPGTGKTYLARALAAHVAERDAIRLVQFHPSYSYEDFFEGFRPVETTDGGSGGFAKMPGPLRKIAADAASNPGRPYVLIIDEINRANLAKVFGELYFLLEYRDASVLLQYTPSEAFNLPPNVFIVGTMNTADRSIALVDAAIRRRFAFIELHPDEPPVRDVLRTWLIANGKDGDERAALLAALNDAIDAEDHDFKIGPSYLMRPNLDSEAALQRVWQYELLPLLEEHYYGRLTRAQIRARFGLPAIRTRIAAWTESRTAGTAREA
ncbi:MAG TPA: AAA family ATPase [Micromonosporaceae bacterium]